MVKPIELPANINTMPEVVSAKAKCHGIENPTKVQQCLSEVDSHTDSLSRYSESIRELQSIQEECKGITQKEASERCSASIQRQIEKKWGKFLEIKRSIGKTVDSSVSDIRTRAICGKIGRYSRKQCLLDMGTLPTTRVFIGSNVRHGSYTLQHLIDETPVTNEPELKWSLRLNLGIEYDTPKWPLLGAEMSYDYSHASEKRERGTVNELALHQVLLGLYVGIKIPFSTLIAGCNVAWLSGFTHNDDDTLATSKLTPNPFIRLNLFDYNKLSVALEYGLYTSFFSSSQINPEGHYFSAGVQYYFGN